MAVRILLALTLLVARSQAFSLLGPYADWMQPTNGFRQPGDIGGPMNLGAEYRWNVPVLTYAFDQSFLDYFGSNGVAAVEQAIQTFNDLPPASSVVLADYPLDSKEVNYAAQAQGLYDLKSAVLYLVIEQLGLGAPTRNIYVLRRWHPTFVQFPSEPQWYPELFPDFLLEQNFDPETLAATHYVNGTLYYGMVQSSGDPNPAPLQADVLEFVVDPFAPTYTAVSDRTVGAGEFLKALTQDDAGGLRYLLGTNNNNFEALLPDVHGVGPNIGSYVNQAIRPGVDKITFVRPNYDVLLAQFFSPYTNQFTDTYITNNTLVHQQLERVLTQPDFLFCAGDTGAGSVFTADVLRTGTSNWWRSGSSELDGPGVIRPPVKFTFHKFGPTVTTDDSQPEGTASIKYRSWGSFDSSTNPPVAYPSGAVSGGHQLTLRLRLGVVHLGSTETIEWHSPVPFGGLATLQTSTNLSNWVTLATVTNAGVVVEWYHARARSRRFFRAVPQ